MLHINDLTYRIGDRLLIDRATLALPARAKAGLVGRNGVGKTTLFRLIAGEIGAESGSVSIPRNSRIGQVAQEAPASDQSLVDVVLAADEERSALLSEAETATDPHRIADIQTRLADIDAHSAEARASAILAGLGFATAEQNGPCSALSGGWRMRVALAATLFARPDFLLLDEPTNYLDLEGSLWLETYIARYPYCVIIISHDRELLNNAVDTIVHMDEARLTVYRGNYDQFDRQRRERQALQLKLKKKQAEQRHHLEAFVERFRYKASKARQAQSRLKALAKMQPIAAIADQSLRGFSFPAPAKAARPPIITMEKVAVGYGGAPVLTELDLRIDDDDRIGLLGANGNGKSTLAKLIAGRLSASAGGLRRMHRLEIAYFAQHQLDELKPEQSPYDHVRDLMAGATEAQVRARVGAMGFTTGKMNTRARNLSGGEKARLLLGLATFVGPHLMILDEPTNHLDVDSRESLITALADFPGAVILISHDRHLLEASVDRLWLVAEGSVNPYDGDLQDYRRTVLEQRGSGNSRSRQSKIGASPATKKRREAARARSKNSPLRKNIKNTEGLIQNLQKQIQVLDRQLAESSLHMEAPQKAALLSRQRAEISSRINEAEERWLNLSAQAEE